MEGRDLDAIVVELSGVADPVAVRRNWEQAIAVSLSPSLPKLFYIAEN